VFSFNKENNIGYLIFENNDKTQRIEFEITSKSLINKIDFLLEDLNFVNKTFDGFDDFFLKFNYDITQQDLIDAKTSVKMLVDVCKILSHGRIKEVDNFCDINKKTRNSIFFDKDELREILNFIAVMKLLAPFIHSKYKDLYKHNIEKILGSVADEFKEVNRKLYKIISSKALRGSIDSKKFMSFLKYSITYDYLILYNYSFITTLLLCVYNWKTNPVSFIVSLATDNFNFLVMTYSNLPFVYKEEINLDNVSSDLFETVSYEMIINSITDKIDVPIQRDVYVTPINSIIVLPLISYVSDIPVKYLKSKPHSERLMFQYLLYKLINNIDVNLDKDVITDIKKILLYGFSENKQNTNSNSVLAMMLEVLKETFTYYGLDNKTPLLNSMKNFSILVYNRKHLIHIISGEHGKFDSNEINNMLKSIALFMIHVVSDETRDEFRKKLKIEFLKMLGDIHINQLISIYGTKNDKVHKN